ncbi:TetR/AcrR family transcriptional regulator [Pedosphaera parvula]|uniref:Transcriptional regulator, TetR family n=1 Tax=Pedosphaera parvula (strain Ellin514) TaxID=320771 RepID=B9XB35_PEDPL|nr:TetR/AcrR family transcriptional regulator [Pedosphaera parvula]EEF62720.1 transcriptional regulator, TetR family [Pedosphaera parvula Ellin514]
MNVRIQLKHASVGGGSESHSETRKRVLDTAERLFAEKGLEAVSVRDITQAAEVNLGAINYHFGTKEALIAEVFERRLTPLNRARLAQLDVLEKATGRKPLKVEEVLDSFIRPAFEQAQNPEQGGLNFCKLMGRCLAEPNVNLEKFMLKQFQPLMERFDAAMKRAVPSLAGDDVFWRLHFTVGALHHCLLTMDQLAPNWVKNCVDIEEQIQRLITFAAAGVRAHLPSSSSKS